jgi:hypothetical protein
MIMEKPDRDLDLSAGRVDGASRQCGTGGRVKENPGSVRSPSLIVVMMNRVRLAITRCPARWLQT